MGRRRRSGQERPCRPPRRAPKDRHHSSLAELAVAGGIFIAILLLPVVPKNLSLWDNDQRSGRGRF
ncbi:MAG: hypothetical protein M3R70_03450 [Actinomycetota bacterium]|nr:hypothetical protein [Actinomycetota bacterium]